jgi:hypothetical protein
MRVLPALVPLALLAACGDKPAPEGDDRSASGEVLDGTISDSMLPLDQLTSEPPLLEPDKAPPAAETAGDEAGEPEAEASEPAPEAAPETPED